MRTAKKQPGKVAMAFGYIVVLSVLALVIWGVVSVFSGSPKKTAPTTKTRQQTTAVKTAPSDPKTQAVSLLTGATSDYEKLYSKALGESAETDAAKASSDFYMDKTTLNSKPDWIGYNAYKKASDTYSTAKLDPQAILDTWNTDSSQLYTDITNWVNAKYDIVLDQQDGGIATPAHTAKATTAEQTYNNDLAKVKADIAKL